MADLECGQMAGNVVGIEGGPCEGADGPSEASGGFASRPMCGIVEVGAEHTCAIFSASGLIAACPQRTIWA